LLKVRIGCLTRSTVRLDKRPDPALQIRALCVRQGFLSMLSGRRPDGAIVL
jgi:hypothetical protein